MDSRLKISISFDDARKDTYDVAYKIMKKYNLVGTIHVITGYVDGTYNKRDVNGSYGACSWDELYELKEYGFEISMHGDQHITDIDDLNVCRSKLLKNKLITDKVGFSVPHSLEQKLDTSEFRDYYINNLSYIRVGKNNSKLNIIKKTEYFFYQYLHISFMFWLYNKININDLSNYDKYRIHSIVIKNNNKISEIKKFINNNLNTNNWLVFMFHSVNDNGSVWCFDIDKFEEFCIFLSDLIKKQKVSVETIYDVVNG